MLLVRNWSTRVGMVKKRFTIFFINHFQPLAALACDLLNTKQKGRAAECQSEQRW